MSVEHHTLRFERAYPHPPSRVFAAWTDAAVKRRWFTFSADPGEEWSMDFRVGGAEAWRPAPDAAPPRVTYDGTFHDIVPDERIVVAARVTIDGRPSSVAVSTAEFVPTGEGSVLRVVEQLALLDGLETLDDRRGGVGRQLEALAACLDATDG